MKKSLHLAIALAAIVLSGCGKISNSKTSPQDNTHTSRLGDGLIIGWTSVYLRQGGCYPTKVMCQMYTGDPNCMKESCSPQP